MSGKSIADMVFKGVDRFGVSVVLLLIFIYLSREAAIAIHKTIVEPVVQTHTTFVNTLAEQFRHQTDAMKAQADAFRSLSDAHEEQTSIMRRAFPEVVRSVEAPQMGTEARP